jgi:hypothetical protein
MHGEAIAACFLFTVIEVMNSRSENTGYRNFQGRESKRSIITLKNVGKQFKERL